MIGVHKLPMIDQQVGVNRAWSVLGMIDQQSILVGPPHPGMWEKVAAYDGPRQRAGYRGLSHALYPKKGRGCQHLKDERERDLERLPPRTLDQRVPPAHAWMLHEQPQRQRQPFPQHLPR